MKIPARVPRGQRMPVVAPRDELREQAERWWTNKQLSKQIEAQLEGDKGKDNGLRHRVRDVIVATGKKFTDNPSRRVLFNPPIGELYGIEARASVIPQFNEMVAAGLLSQRKLTAECSKTTYTFDPEQIPLIVQTLTDAGVLDECLLEPPQTVIDPDLIVRYHQLNPEVITEADIDLMMPDKVTYALYPITTPVREVDADVD